VISVTPRPRKLAKFVLEERMPTTHPVAVTFEHILVPTDFSDVSRRALEYAKTLAKPGNSELLLAHVTPGANMVTPPEAAWIDAAEIEDLVEQELEESGAALRSEGYRARAVSFIGPLCDQLLSAIKEYEVDLIVLGTHGRKGLERLLLGSDAEALLRHAHCPVISIGPGVKENKTWHLREVICATTLEPHSAEVVAYAQKLALQHGAGLILLHVKDVANETGVDWVSFEEAFHYYALETLGKSSWLRTRLSSAAPGISIVDLAKQRGSDLIVMGARPASSMATHLPPGIAAKVLLEAPCPVMTLLQP
jgi:nucleotide-binding universal stress UspA family protein